MFQFLVLRPYFALSSARVRIVISLFNLRGYGCQDLQPRSSKNTRHSTGQKFNKNDIVFLSASNKMGAVVANLKPKTGRLGGLGGFGGHAWTVMEFRCCNDADLESRGPRIDNQFGLRQMDAIRIERDSAGTSRLQSC